jgi:chloride channel 7
VNHVQTEMRTFFRRYFTHNRYVSATATPLEALQLNQALGGAGSVDLSSLYIDMRPYMNRSPFTVRRDCSASRVHQVGLEFVCVVLGCCMAGVLSWGGGVPDSWT